MLMEKRAPNQEEGLRLSVGWLPALWLLGQSPFNCRAVAGSYQEDQIDSIAMKLTNRLVSFFGVVMHCWGGVIDLMLSLEDTGIESQ